MWRVENLGLYAWLVLALLGQSSSALIRQGQEDLAAGRYSRAEEEISQALKAEPSNWSLWYYLGVARVQLKETGPAMEAFEKARALAPEEAPAYFGLGLLYMQNGEVEKALEAYRDGLARDANDVAANQNYALLLMGKGGFREAVKPLLRLKRINSGDVSTRATLIEAYLRAGMKSEGEAEIDQFLTAHLATLREDLSLAKLLGDDRETEAAEKVLKYVTSTWPDSAEAHGELGLLLIGRAKFSDAAEEFERAVQLDPESGKYSLGLGQALLRSEQFPAALQFLLSVQKKFGDQPDFQFLLALAYLSVQRYTEAISELEKLVPVRPDSGRVQFFLAGSYKSIGDFKKAEACYRRAIQLEPQEPIYYRDLGSLLKKQDPAHLAEAKQLLNKALALDPSDEETKLDLASCLEKEGKLEEAVTLLEQVIVANPASRRAHAALAQLYYRQKKPAQAEKERAIADSLEEKKVKEVLLWGP